MESLALTVPRRDIRCRYRPILLAATAIVVISVFWIAPDIPS